MGSLVVAALALVGCRTDEEVRRESRDETLGRLREETRAFFATNSAPLTLRSAIDLARTRTLKLTQTSLEASLAGIDKGTAFSAFLPRLDARYMYMGTDRNIETVPIIAGQSVSFGDKFESAQLSLTQPLFVPNAWLMFFEARHLHEAQKYRLARARQLLDVQVTAQFYELAVADELIRSYASETNSTASLLRQVEGLVEEGYATRPDLERVKTKLLRDTYRLHKAENSADVARANLADILRFLPGEKALRADGASMTAALENPLDLPLETAVYTALTNRPDLFAADRMTRVREIEIYRALTEWLPEFALTGAGTHTSQDLLDSSQYWSGGFVGAMSLFKGFQSVNDYRRAKAQRQAEYELLESRMMAVVVAVVQAHHNRAEADEAARVAASARESARLDYEAAKEKFDEGRETFSNLMDKITALEAAKVAAARAEYARALAEIVLRNAIGMEISL